MSNQSIYDVRKLAQAGIQDLQQGRPQNARQAFERVIQTGAADASIMLGLAYACRALNDSSAALNAINQALTLEPQNLYALMFKADHFTNVGDDQAASSYYKAAIDAAQMLDQVPVEFHAELSRADSMLATLAKKFEAYLAAKLRPLLTSIEEENPLESRRFQQSLDLLLGKKQVYFQSPRLYFFPGLPQIQFYDRSDFPWFDQLEAATDTIREELLAVLARENTFAPYVQSTENRPSLVKGSMLNNPDWSAFYLWKDGQVVAENAARCPKTMEALSHLPLAEVPGRSPTVLFSLLKPGARIPPHTGVLNTRLICHLPLIVPGDCGLRVGNETREWVEGVGWLFDDTIEHEAWNNSDQTRVILLFEIWRPELSTSERALVSQLLTSVDSYSDEKKVWGM